MKFKIWTEISGGVTGNRGAYMKENGEEIVFDDRQHAERYIEILESRRSPHATFTQTYRIEEC